MVKRYELSEEWGNPVMTEYDHGDWVGYADYEELDKDFQDYITTTEMELKELREKLGLSN